MTQTSTMSQASLKITEIFYSLQGESTTVGLPTVFVRLTGCPLRCGYCDSEYAFYGGERLLLDDILAKVASFNPRYICVTGGEPLAQRECLTLLTAKAVYGDADVVLSGSGNIYLDLDYGSELNLALLGSGRVEWWGAPARLNYELSGTGKVVEP